MRILIVIFMGIFAFIACNTPNSNSSKSDNEQAGSEETTTVGGEKDEHGCLVSAGELWSQIRQDCLQIFNAGQRLNPIHTKDGEAVISSFILFNNDKSELELFLPDPKNGSVILKSIGNGIYEADSYKFDIKDSSLYMNGTKAYSVQNEKQ